jgi:hypothetical protein
MAAVITSSTARGLSRPSCASSASYGRFWKTQSYQLTVCVYAQGVGHIHSGTYTHTQRHTHTHTHTNVFALSCGGVPWRGRRERRPRACAASMPVRPTAAAMWPRGLAHTHTQRRERAHGPYTYRHRHILKPNYTQRHTHTHIQTHGHIGYLSLSLSPP